MYLPVSPNRQMRVMNSQVGVQRTLPDRSKSPLQPRQGLNPPIQPQPQPQIIMPNVNIIGNVHAPPGMQTVLKPKIYEAVEVPSNHLQILRQPSQVQLNPQFQQQQIHISQHPQSQTQEQEQIKRIALLENELNSYRIKIMQIESMSNMGLDQEKVNQRFSEKNREIELLNDEKIYLQEQLRQINHSMAQEMYTLQHRSTSDNDQNVKFMKLELDEQKRILTQQCEAYYKQYQQSEQEKQELLYKIRQIEAQNIKLQNLQNQIQDQSERDNLLMNEIKTWKQKYNQSEEDRIRQVENLREEYERIYNQQYEGMRQNFENKCRILEDEMDRTRDQLNETTREAETWRSKYHQEDLDKLSHTQKISQLELQSLHQQKDLDRTTLGNQQKTQEIESLRQRINQLEYNHVQILQPSLETELKRLREQMDSRNRELEDLRKRNHEIEQYCVKMKEIEVEYDILQHKKYHELDRSSQDFSKFKHMYEQLLNEYEDLKSRFQKSETTVQDLKRSEYRIQQEMQRINDLLRLKDEEMNRQAQDYKRNMLQLQNQVNQFKEQQYYIKLYNSERELSSVYNTKNRNEQEFKDNLERKFNIMKEELENQRKEREQLLQTCSQLNQTKIQLENKIVLLTGELDRLNQVIRAKYEEHQNLKENYRIINDQLEQSQYQNEELRREGDNYKSRGRDPDMNYRNSAPKVFEPRTYENSHKGSVSKPYDSSQLPSQKHFEIPSHQQDFN